MAENSNPNQALESLKMIHSVQEDNNKKLSVIRRQYDEAKNEVMQYMKTTGQTFVTIGNKEYLTIQTKSSKPQRNDEFIGVTYRLHCRDNLHRQPTDEEVEKYIETMARVSAQLSEQKEELVFTKSKPIMSLLA